jgi:hypothetical protein
VLIIDPTHLKTLNRDKLGSLLITLNHNRLEGIPKRNFEMNPSSLKKSMENEIPNHAIPIFENSYIIKKGYLMTTGIDVLIHSSDAKTIQKAAPKDVDAQIEKVAQSIGHPEYAEKIGKIFKWVAENHYEKEKDSLGNLRCTIDFLKIISGKKIIKIGENWYSLPPELLKKRKRHSDFIR